MSNVWLCKIIHNSVDSLLEASKLQIASHNKKQDLLGDSAQDSTYLHI